MSTPLHELGEVRLGVECCIICDDSTLLVKRAPDTKFFPNLLAFPGGHVDQGENVKEAAIREVFEETGLLLKPEQLTLRLFTTNHHQDKHLVWIITAFTAILSEKLEPTSSSEGECGWYPLQSLDKSQVVPPVLEYFEHMVTSKGEIIFSNGEYLNGQLITPTK